MTSESDNDWKILEELSKLPGARRWGGECSSQVDFTLADGNILNFGITDEDVAANVGLWFRVYTPRPSNGKGST